VLQPAVRSSLSVVRDTVDVRSTPLCTVCSSGETSDEEILDAVGVQRRQNQVGIEPLAGVSRHDASLRRGES
jgi:hypothetical protein